MSGNSIQTVEEDALANLPSLLKLDISENPFVCDCNLQWFIKKLHKLKYLQSVQKTKCALPVTLTDTPIMQIDTGNKNNNNNGCDLSVIMNKFEKKPKMMSLNPDSNVVAFENDQFSVECVIEGKIGLYNLFLNFEVT